jgi:hypothetical protein
VATGWAESKVSRLENGKQNPSEADIRVWCVKTNRQEHVDDLIATVRHIDELWLEWRRQLQTGAERRQRKALPVYAKTKVFRIWHPTLVWGTLQTADYAAETFRQVVDYYEIPDDAEAATAKRLERQQYLYRGNRIFNVVLGEQALYTNFGGPEVMKGVGDVGVREPEPAGGEGHDDNACCDERVSLGIPLGHHRLSFVGPVVPGGGCGEVGQAGCSWGWAG